MVKLLTKKFERLKNYRIVLENFLISEFSNHLIDNKI